MQYEPCYFSAAYFILKRSEQNLFLFFYFFDRLGLKISGSHVYYFPLRWVLIQCSVRLAQLVRAHPSHGWGQEFESPSGHHFFSVVFPFYVPFLPCLAEILRTRKLRYGEKFFLGSGKFKILIVRYRKTFSSNSVPDRVLWTESLSFPYGLF